MFRKKKEKNKKQTNTEIFILTLFQLIDSWYSLRKGQDGITISVKALHPKSRGSVKLKSSDPYDQPIIDPKYLSNYEDIDTLVKGMSY